VRKSPWLSVRGVLKIHPMNSRMVLPATWKATPGAATLILPIQMLTLVATST
jgi:hypothetical protein